MFDLKIVEKILPFELEDFIDNQSLIFEKKKQSLLIQWRQYPLGDICDIIRNIPHYIQSFNDIQIYNTQKKNSLKRFLRRIDFFFRNQVKDFLNLNLEKWINFIKKFTLPDENAEDLWVVEETPLLKVCLDFKELKKKEKKKKK